MKKEKHTDLEISILGENARSIYEQMMENERKTLILEILFIAISCIGLTIIIAFLFSTYKGDIGYGGLVDQIYILAILMSLVTIFAMEKKINKITKKYDYEEDRLKDARKLLSLREEHKIDFDDEELPYLYLKYLDDNYIINTKKKIVCPISEYNEIVAEQNRPTTKAQRKAMSKYIRRRYAEDEEFREQQKKRARKNFKEKLKDPEFKKKHYEKMREYQQTPKFKEYQKQYDKERYQRKKKEE